MTWFSLTIIGGTAGSDFLSQIDSKMLITGNGSPIGTVAAGSAGVWYFDKVARVPYLCQSTDGSGLPAGTTWAAQNFVVSAATHTQAGIVELASAADVAAQTDDAKAVTAFGLKGIYAKAGLNSDITQLTGLTTALTQAQGGTGYTTFLAALLAALPGKIAGYVLNTDGTNLNWVPPGTSVVALPNVGGTTLLHGSYNVCNTDGISLILPTSPAVGEVVYFDLGNVTNISLSTSDGAPIQGAAQSLTCNIANFQFGLRYTGNTNGWRAFM